VTEPIPPVPSRGDALGQLRVERWHAVQAKEYGRVAELDRRMQELSAAGTATAPARETAAAPKRQAAARTTKPKPTPKGNRRVSAR
jgi:hypothetical protein